MLDIFCFRISSVNLFPASSLDVESIKDDNSPRNPMIHSLNHICKAILQRSAASTVLTVICQELEQALKKKGKTRYLNMQNTLPERAKTKNHLSLIYEQRYGFSEFERRLCYLLLPEQSTFIWTSFFLTAQFKPIKCKTLWWTGDVISAKFSTHLLFSLPHIVSDWVFCCFSKSVKQIRLLGHLVFARFLASFILSRKI